MGNNNNKLEFKIEEDNHTLTVYGEKGKNPGIIYEDGDCRLTCEFKSSEAIQSFIEDPHRVATNLPPYVCAYIGHILVGARYDDQAISAIYQFATQKVIKTIQNGSE